MDLELKDYLDQRFDVIDHRFAAIDQRFAAIDQGFAAIDQRFAAADQKTDAVQASTFQRMDEIAAALEEGYRDTQTEVLKAVYSMGEPLQMRAATQDVIISSLQQRQASLESRVLEIEKRLHLPPAA